MADWTDYLKKAVVYTNPLTQGTAIGNAIYKDATGDSLIGDITGAAQSPGYDTAAEGAKQAQAYLQQLSQTAWDRQMQGLQGALGSFQGYDALTAQMNPRHGGPAMGSGMPGGQGAGGPPAGAPPALPPPTGDPRFVNGAPPAHSGYKPPTDQTGHTPPGAPPALPPPGTPSTGYAPPPIQPNHVSPYAPPALPPPGAAPPSLAPPGAPPALLPPGSPIGAPPSLAPPGIMDQLAAMMATRSGQGHF